MADKKDNTMVVRIDKSVHFGDILKVGSLMEEAGATKKAIKATVNELTADDVLTIELFVDTKIGGIVKRIAS